MCLCTCLPFTRGEPLDDTSSPADSEAQSLLSRTYASSAGGGAEGSSVGLPEEDLIGSDDVSVGKEECKCSLQQVQFDLCTKTI